MLMLLPAAEPASLLLSAGMLEPIGAELPPIGIEEPLVASLEELASAEVLVAAAGAEVAAGMLAGALVEVSSVAAGAVALSFPLQAATLTIKPVVNKTTAIFFNITILLD